MMRDDARSCEIMRDEGDRPTRSEVFGDFLTKRVIADRFRTSALQRSTNPARAVDIEREPNDHLPVVGLDRLAHAEASTVRGPWTVKPSTVLEFFGVGPRRTVSWRQPARVRRLE